MVNHSSCAEIWTNLPQQPAQDTELALGLIMIARLIRPLKFIPHPISQSHSLNALNLYGTVCGGGVDRVTGTNVVASHIVCFYWHKIKLSNPPPIAYCFRPSSTYPFVITEQFHITCTEHEYAMWTSRRSLAAQVNQTWCEWAVF